MGAVEGAALVAELPPNNELPEGGPNLNVVVGAPVAGVVTLGAPNVNVEGADGAAAVEGAEADVDDGAAKLKVGAPSGFAVGVVPNGLGVGAPKGEGVVVEPEVPAVKAGVAAAVPKGALGFPNAVVVVVFPKGDGVAAAPELKGDEAGLEVPNVVEALPNGFLGASFVPREKAVPVDEGPPVAVVTEVGVKLNSGTEEPFVAVFVSEEPASGPPNNVVPLVDVAGAGVDEVPPEKLNLMAPEVAGGAAVGLLNENEGAALDCSTGGVGAMEEKNPVFVGGAAVGATSFLVVDVAVVEAGNEKGEEAGATAGVAVGLELNETVGVVAGFGGSAVLTKKLGTDDGCAGLVELKNVLGTAPPPVPVRVTGVGAVTVMLGVALDEGVV